MVQDSNKKPAEKAEKKLLTIKHGTFNRTAVLLIVFFAGYLVMALEILAFRTIQAKFGAQIYSTGAVLGVILAALSLGYWLGGTLSTRFVPTRLQATALIFAGIWIFLLAGIPNPISDIFESRANPLVQTTPYMEPPWATVPEWVIDQTWHDSLEVRMRVDPLVGSLILFGFPSVLLAFIGPCAIGALTRRAEEAGHVSGWVFALGSVGSITGVLVTSFWLIAVLGSGANLRLIGLVAVLLAMVAWFVKYEKPGSQK